MAIIGKGQLSLLDLNDAIISGTAPTNPSVGTLWIDSSGAKQILKKWTGSAWEAQPLDLEQLDPEFTEYVSTGVSTALTNLGNLSSDDKVTASERQVIADKLTEILGTVPSGTTALPAVATVNTYTTGDYYQARKSATDAGLSTGDANYTALATAYTTLSTYLNGIVESGSYLWDVSEAAKDKVHTVVGTTFRSNWQAFYNALGNLQTRTAKRVADAKSEAQAYAESYAKSYRSQLVANGFADMASNKNFSGFTYNATEKVTGPGSFLRTATGETRTDEFIKVEGDRTYRMAVSVKSSTTSNTHNIGIECYNAAGTSLGKRHMIRTSAGSMTIPSTTGWVHYEGVIGGLNTVAGAVGDSTFPAGTTQVKIWFNVNVGGVANSFYVADVSFALEQIEANKDYNGISMSADKGLVVESTRNTTTMSATKGIEIKRKSDNVNVFSVDANTGNLNITGNIEMVGGTIAWSSVTKPTPAELGVPTSTDFDGVKNTVTGWTAPGTTEINGTSIRTGTFVADKITTGTLNASLVSVTNLNAANIQSGTLDASKVTISSTTAGVTINNSGVVAENTTNAIKVIMNSTTGFEIQKSGATVFTVNADGRLTAKNITIDGGTITWGTGTGKVTPPTASDVGAAVIGDITSAVSAVQIGGRNLIRYKRSDGSSYFGWSQSTGTVDEATGVIRGVSNGTSNPSWPRIVNHSISVVSFELGVDYTISFWARGSVNAGRTFTISQGDGSNSILTSSAAIETGWKKFQTTFKPSIQPSASTGFYIYTGGTTGDTTSWVEIKELKLEKGNKATDWTPAPEDVDTKIENIEVGGKNYAERLGGSEYEKTKLYSTDGNFTTTQTDANGKLWMRVTGTSVIRINTIKLSPSTRYTWSFYVYTTGTDTVITTQQWHSSGYNSLSHTIGTTPRRIIITFTTPASTTDVNEILHISSLVSADSYFFADFQLERGNKATDWKEAESYTLSKLATALSDASSAKTMTDAMTSDLKVTPLEKNELKRLWDAIKLEYVRINDLGVSLAVSSTTRTNFTNAYNALNSTAPRIETDVLANMNTTYDFVSTTNRDTFRTQINTYFTRREEMEKAIAEQQKTNTSTVTNKVTSWQSIDTTFIDGSKIYTGSITANQIATNAITASKIKVGAVNLINDPFIENAALGTAGATTALSAAVWSAGWSTDEREIVADTTYGKVLRFRRAGDGTLYTNRFGVDPNKAYRITMTFKHSKTDGTAPTGSLYVGTNMYDADGTTEVPTGGFYNIATKTFASGATNPYFYHPGKGNATHTTWKMLDTYILPAAFYNDRTKLKNASHPAGTGQIMYFNPKTRQIHIRVLSLNSGTYGDNSVTVNELQIASLQVTEVDAGTIVADNIVTGTLNAGLITVTNLNAGSITTGTLDASKITVSNLNAGSLTAGTLNGNMVTVTNLNASNINTGTLNAARINAGSLTADKLSFSNNVNLMVDGYDSFENCILPGVGARTSGMTISLDSTYSLDGLKSLKFQGTTTDNYVYLVNADNQTTYNIQVVPGKTYMVSFYAYATDSTTPIEGWIRRGDTGDHIQFRTAQNTVANQWTRYFGKVTIPTGCTRVSVRVDINVANKPVWFDCFKFEECLTTDSEPGPWAAASLTVIDGSNIKTGTIDARVVNVTNIDASNITTGTLNALTITGGNISGGTIDGVGITGSVFDTVATQWQGSGETANLFKYSQRIEADYANYKSEVMWGGTGDYFPQTEVQISSSGLSFRGPDGQIESRYVGNEIDVEAVRANTLIPKGSYVSVFSSEEMLRLSASSGTHGYMTIYDGSTRVGYIGSTSNGTRIMRVHADSGPLVLRGSSTVDLVVDSSTRLSVGSSTTTSQNNLQVNGTITTTGDITVGGAVYGGNSQIQGSLIHTGGYLHVRVFNETATHYSAASASTSRGEMYFSGNTNNRFIFVARTNGGSIVSTSVQASAFPTSSSIKYKEAIEEYTGDALQKIMETKVKTYNLKGHAKANRKVGVIIEEGVPDEIVETTGDAIDPYSMVSMSWKAIQQIGHELFVKDQEIEMLHEQQKTMKKEKTAMKSRMTKLEKKNKELEERLARIEELLKGGTDK